MMHGTAKMTNNMSPEHVEDTFAELSRIAPTNFWSLGQSKAMEKKRIASGSEVKTQLKLHYAYGSLFTANIRFRVVPASPSVQFVVMKLGDSTSTGRQDNELMARAFDVFLRTWNAARSVAHVRQRIKCVQEIALFERLGDIVRSLPDEDKNSKAVDMKPTDAEMLNMMHSVQDMVQPHGGSGEDNKKNKKPQPPASYPKPSSGSSDHATQVQQWMSNPVNNEAWSLYKAKLERYYVDDITRKVGPHKSAYEKR